MKDTIVAERTAPNLTIGLLCAVGVIFVWSGFLVFSRAGVLTGLTPYDLAALRFGIAALLTLPFAWAWWPRQLSWQKQAVLALCGPGALYTVLMFVGLAKASAAYGGVFSNGSLPIFTTLIGLALTGALPGRLQMLASAIIVAGGIMVAYRGMTGGEDVVQGIVFFLIGSAVIAIYIVSIRRWGVTPRQILAIINVPNALVFLPIWYLFLPTGLATADMQVIVLQGLFQGFGPGFLALILFAMMAYHLGPGPTAAFAAAVPATAALLAIPVLGEIPEALEWAGILTVTLGLGLLVRAR